jgi:hypothetical protein
MAGELFGDVTIGEDRALICTARKALRFSSR